MTDLKKADINLPVAIVTGASSGIGYKTAELLAIEGYRVFAIARRIAKVQELAAKLARGANGEVVPVGLDVNDYPEVEAFFKENSEVLKNLRVLVNNAGLAKGTESLQKGQRSDWQQMMQTNVMALLDMTKLCLGNLMQNKGSTVVNIGSVAGRWIYPGGAVYCASKFAVRAISEGLRMDLAGSGVRVCNLEPGMVETGFSEVRFGDAEKAKQVYQGMTPLTAEDMAKTVLWLVNQPAHINVQELVVFPTDQAAVGQVTRRL